MSPGGSRGKAIYSRPTKFGTLAVALAVTAGTLFVSAQPGYASKPHLAAAVGDISEYTVPTTTQGDPAFIASGPDGNLWFTDNINNQVAKVTTPVAATAYRVPTYGGALLGIVAGPDGNLWFADGLAIGKVTTSGVFTLYTIPTTNSFPYGIAAGPDGNLWFTEDGANKVAKVTTSGVFTEYTIPTANSSPYGIAAGPDGNLWFAEGAGKVAKVTTSGVFTEYAIPTANSYPNGIAAGPDGKLWCAEGGANKVAKATTSGAITEYALPTANAYPNDIAAGPDGNLWFTESAASKVAKVTTSGVFTEYPVPAASSPPYAITGGPDGNVWFTETRGGGGGGCGFVSFAFVGAVAKVTTSGVLTEYRVNTATSGPLGITAGPDGNLWFTEDRANKVARVTMSGAFTEYSLPTAQSVPGSIAAGSDGNLWFTEGAVGKVAKVTTSGVVTEYAIPNSCPTGIAAGPDGNLWFTDGTNNKVGRVTTSGVVTEYPIPTANASPGGIAAGPDGNLWFTESSANKVAKVTTSGGFTEYPIPTPNSFLSAIVVGPDGNLWFTEDAGKVSKVTTSGVVTEYTIPTLNAFPAGIAAGLDGNLWFTDGVNNQVDRVTTSGAFTAFPVPTASSYPFTIAAGPNGNLWFTEQDGNKVAMVVASVAPSCPAAGATPATVRASSTSQYTLANSDGATWKEIDAAKLQVTCAPTANQSILLTANADLFTGKAGYNQDLGIFVSDNGAADQLLAWKESGGFAGTFSPNAAYVQGVLNMVTGNTYVFKLKWKTNKPAAGATIYVGAGSGPYSPTSLIAETFPAGTVPNFAVSTSQYTLSNSDGATWQPIDAVKLATSLSPTVDAIAVLDGNADLWTANPGYNQDLGIFVSDNTGPDTLVGWKESGGFAGTYSPNAAFVKATYAMTAGHTYKFTLKWKTNKSAVGTGATIVAAGGGGPVYSQTSLLAETAGTMAAGSTLSTSQYSLSNSNGVTWQTIDPVLNTGGPITVDTNAIVGGNADLWTASPGFNKDIGIFVAGDTGADVLLAWKESGGFAGTYSPNAAFVQTTYRMTAGHTYMFKLKWKTNKNAPGATIYAAAGGGPVYSQTRLTVEFTS